MPSVVTFIRLPTNITLLSNSILDSGKYGFLEYTAIPARFFSIILSETKTEDVSFEAMAISDSWILDYFI